MCLRAQLRYGIYKSTFVVSFTDFGGSSGHCSGCHSRSGGKVAGETG